MPRDTALPSTGRVGMGVPIRTAAAAGVSDVVGCLDDSGDSESSAEGGWA